MGLELSVIKHCWTTYIKSIQKRLSKSGSSVTFIEASPEHGQLVKLQVINGTNWLNLGGDVHSFKLVLGKPPSTSSDVTLLEALDQLNQVKKHYKMMSLKL